MKSIYVQGQLHFDCVPYAETVVLDQNGLVTREITIKDWATLIRIANFAFLDVIPFYQALTDANLPMHCFHRRDGRIRLSANNAAATIDGQPIIGFYVVPKIVGGDVMDGEVKN
jgi:hypothetical protein